MTVGQLIEALKVLPPDAEVVLARDAEGNGFSSLETVDPTRWDGEDVLWDEAGEEHASIDDFGGDACVALWP